MRGIYIHFPYCASRCSYCSFVSGAPHGSMPHYVAALKKEIEERLPFGERISTVYIGGGTPSVMYRGAIADVLSLIKSRAVIDENTEITVECNPDSVTAEFVGEIVNAGVNRVSIGLQSDCDRLLAMVNRPHTKQKFLDAWELLCPIKNKSVDLMLGLPGQTEADLISSLRLVMELKAPHVSLYALKCEEGTPLYASGFTEDEDFEEELYQRAYGILTANGYTRYEVSNFCRDDSYSRHNFSYWDMVDYYGFGVAAHSYLDGKRIANGENVSKYILGNPERSEVDVSSDRAEEYIMLALRTSKGIDLDRLKGYGVDLLASKKAEIDSFIRDGLLKLSGGHLMLADSAYYIMNTVIVALI